MDTGTVEFRLLALTIFFASVLASIISPVLVYLYRKRVSQLMRQTTTDGLISSTSGTLSDISLSAQSGKAEPSLRSVSLQNNNDLFRQDICTFVQRKLSLIALAYVLAALSHALIVTLFFSFAHRSLLSSSVIYVAFVIFALPAIPTALHILVASKLKRSIVLSIVLALCYIALGHFRGLGFALFQLYLLIPIILLLIFGMRFWRGVAPLGLLIAILGSLGWMMVWKSRDPSTRNQVYCVGPSGSPAVRSVLHWAT